MRGSDSVAGSDSVSASNAVAGSSAVAGPSAMAGSSAVAGLTAVAGPNAVAGSSAVGDTVRKPSVLDRPVDPRRELGRRGEDLAAEYLTGLGLVVLERNWRCREGELDIIATDGIGRVYFCEVKTRSGEGYGIPAESVTRGKRRKIRRLATIWLSTHLSDWRPTQFDVIAVLWPPGGRPQISYLPGAF